MAQTAAKPRARRGSASSDGGSVAVTPADFKRVDAWLDTHVLVERTLEVRLFTVALAAGLNLHLLGPAGVAKSLGLREKAKCITGAIYFEKPMNEELSVDELIGPPDIPALANEGVWRRTLTGHLPTADVGFVDEVFRSNGIVQNALLPIANTSERQAIANGGMIDIPLLSLVTASNTMPDPDNLLARAFVDRLTFLAYVERVKADDSFKEILRRSDARMKEEVTNTVARETLTVEQVREAQRQVKLVRLTPEFLDAIANLRRQVFEASLATSDRGWVEITQACRACAWLAGRDFCIAEDLVIAEHAIWRDPDERPTAHALVLPFHGRFEREANDKRDEATEPLAMLEEARPIIEALDPSEDMPQEVFRKITSARRRLKIVRERVDALLVEAESEQREATGLRDLANEITVWATWLQNYGIPL